jgi:hypothetical protein
MTNITIYDVTDITEEDCFFPKSENCPEFWTKRIRIIDADGYTTVISLTPKVNEKLKIQPVS